MHLQMTELHSYKMKLFVVGCVFVAYFVHVLLANRKECSFSVHGPSEKNSPILLQNSTAALIVPNKGKVNLKARETVTLLCPDPRNYLVGTESNITEAQCVQGKILRTVNRDVNFEDLQCKKIIRGTVHKTTKKCGNDQGHIHKIGYPVSSRQFIAVIEVCYDSSVGVVLYTQHFLHGQDIKYASKSNYRPSFSPEGSTVSASVAYKQAFQKAALNKLLKSALISSEYINENSYLDRGHLSPDADFLYAATQYTSYYLINTSPQWLVINRGNWKRVEVMVRKFADALQETLTVVTGTYEVLTFPDVNGEETELYLVSGDKMPVPKYIWKIVFSTKSRKAIVLISLNNPFIREISDEYFLCENVCNEVGWNSASWSNYGHGLIYCCSYEQFARRVKTAPKLVVVGLLSGSK